MVRKMIMCENLAIDYDKCMCQGRMKKRYVYLDEQI